ncbi:MAG: hypothetical protein LC797_02285, partial [Chloroflexi bacterium]|nr:hypothetical protein [Chloroflexota bacterium]
VRVPGGEDVGTGTRVVARVPMGVGLPEALGVASTSPEMDAVAVSGGLAVLAGVGVTAGVADEVAVRVGLVVTSCAALTLSGSVRRLATISGPSKATNVIRPNTEPQSAIARAHLSRANLGFVGCWRRRGLTI